MPDRLIEIDPATRQLEDVGVTADDIDELE
jgi:hypothetical protein